MQDRASNWSAMATRQVPEPKIPPSLVCEHDTGSSVLWIQLFLFSLSKQLLDKLHRLSKSGVRATLQQRTLVPTAPLLELLGVPSLPQRLLQKLTIFVFKCLNDKTSPLLKNLFVPINDPATPQLRTTRGQVSSLLRVPFLPGPAGRRSILFVCSILWNALPVAVRTEGDWRRFKALATALDLPSLYPY